MTNKTAATYFLKSAAWIVASVWTGAAAAHYLPRWAAFPVWVTASFGILIGMLGIYATILLSRKK